METKPEAPIAKSEMSSTEAAEFLHVTRRSVARFATEGKLNVLFYAVTCTFIHDKVGQCPVCGGRSSLQKDDLRALLKPSRVNRHNTMDFYHIRKTNHASQFTLLRASSRNGR